MDVSILHTLTEDLAAFLSEVTQGDLRRPMPSASRDVGDLYLHLLDQNVSVAAAVTGETITRGRWPNPRDRTSMDAPLDYYGGGLEVSYRQTARLMEDAFASVADSSLLCRVKGLPGEVEVATLHEMQISNAVIHTWDIAQVLGFPYRPVPTVTQRILRTIVLRATQTQPDALAGDTGVVSHVVDEADIFECVLKLSGRNEQSRVRLSAS